MQSNDHYLSKDPRARGGVRRYLDSVAPTDFIPPYGDIKLSAVTLTGLADFYGTDKGSLKHSYTDVYEKLIGDLLGCDSRISAKLRVTEIGVACGASLRMWSDYLPESEIYGYDIRQECASLCGDKANIRITIRDLTKEIPAHSSHLLVDDGSHISEDIVAAFTNCWPTVVPGGYYVIEDLSCTYRGGYARQFESSFGRKVENNRETIRNFVDVMMQSVDFREDIECFRYYPQLLVIKKKR